MLTQEASRTSFAFCTPHSRLLFSISTPCCLLIRTLSFLSPFFFCPSRPCSIIGGWSHGKEQYYVMAGATESTFGVTWPHTPGGKMWHNGTLTLGAKPTDPTKIRPIGVVYDTGIKKEGSLLAGCSAITWSDHTRWQYGILPPSPPSPPSPPLPPGALDPKTIKEVIVMQSCHLDVGFADFSTNIINRFFYEHFANGFCCFT